VINVEEVNPRLFAVSVELAIVRQLRRRLVAAKRYLVVCRWDSKANKHLNNVDIHT